MGKKSAKNSSLGRALIKDRFKGHHNRGAATGDCMLHTTEMTDAKAKTNYQSVTEESQLDELLYKATMAGQFYETEQQDVRVLKGPAGVGLLSDAEYQKAQETHQKFRDSLKIPRRPIWTTDMPASTLDRIENESFWEWRKSLAEAQEANGFLLTPYEKNLEFWRQLWRVVERSDVVVQIVDARNPLLFWCEDLEKYVKEVSELKLNMLLVNKADFLTETQRQLWADYFSSIGVKVAFFSALEPAENSSTEQAADGPQGSNYADKDELEKDIKTLEQAVEAEGAALGKIIAAVDALVDKSNCKEDSSSCSLSLAGSSKEDFVINDTRVLSREELIDLFHTMHKGPKVTADITTIGLVGYPNVGKSSTINSLLMAKKVSVSATPGKTKHFQTFYLDDDIILCDCPGLVMPSFVFTKADMVLNGILPIDHMRDHVSPISLVTQRFPRHVLEDMYGIMLPIPRADEEDPQRCPTAEEFLNAYAYNRGFMTAHGQPDGSRAARKVLKDYTSGKLVYCHAPKAEETVNMQFQLFSGLVLFAVMACAFAHPLIAPEDDEGQQYLLKSQALTHRLRREAAQGFGAGGANGKSQGGYAGFSNPNGSGGSVGYGHANGQGHTVSVDGRVPVWSNKNRLGESTLNVGGGATQHFGGPGGNRNLDKRVGVDFNHRF